VIAPERTGGSRRGRVLLPTLVVLGLVAAVAVAATGSTPSGTDRSRSPGHVFVDTFFTFSLVLLLVGAILLVYGLTQRQAIRDEMALRGFRRFGLPQFLVLIAIFTAAAYFRLRSQGVRFGRGGEDGAPQQDGGRFPDSGDLRDYHANFAWLPLLVVLVLVAVSVLAWRLAVRRRAAAAADTEIAVESLADAIEDSLADLRAERDARRAIIAAYARMERALAAFGFPRRGSETQDEYLSRILRRLEVEPGAIRRLTDLFTRAKFSHHEVETGMKEEAIEALEQVRDELRAAQALRTEELAEQSKELARA
jgi:hypothetical protein